MRLSSTYLSLLKYILFHLSIYYYMIESQWVQTCQSEVWCEWVQTCQFEVWCEEILCVCFANRNLRQLIIYINCRIIVIIWDKCEMWVGVSSVNNVSLVLIFNNFISCNWMQGKTRHKKVFGWYLYEVWYGIKEIRLLLGMQK